ncbi:MAG TPA: hypothetical protein VFY93_08755 [Planctomycetota bacterium]|nr:hypothetical protein [Planctomycetota bacterium]
MDKETAGSHGDLQFIRQVMERTQARIDPHAFHFVLWGALVLIAYPLANWAELAGRGDLGNWTGGVMLGLGVLGSCLLEMRLKARPRLEGENTFVSRQVVLLVFYHIGVASLLTVVGPVTGFIEGPFVPHLWGFAYASMMYTIGVVYTREYTIAGFAILLGTVIALFDVEHAGMILGPFMGLGAIVPGLIAERRVARLRGQLEP